MANKDDEITPAPLPHTAGKDDVAKDFLAAHSSDAAFTYEEEKHVLSRIDRRLLPLLLGAYFFQQLDKSTLSYTSIFGIQQDANLHGQQYSWLGSILYFAELVFQPLVAFALVKFPNGKILAGAVFCWGSALAIMAACTNFSSLLGMRFVLGAFEALIAPTCVAVTQMWWRRSEQTLRSSYWNAMNGVTQVVGSLFTYGLGHIISDRMYRYQIIFLFCGLLTVLFSVLVGLLMPDSPMEAKYLTEREKVIAVERLRANQMGVATRKWNWSHVREVALDIKTYLWFVAITSISIASGGISTFGSLIVNSFGYDPFQTILFNLPFGVIQVVVIIGSAWIATRYSAKGLTIAAVSVLPIIGTVLMLTVSREQKGVLLFGYYLVSCLAAITPMIYAWQAQNTGGDTKKKCNSAVVFIGMCTGNIIGPQLYSPNDAPLYRKGLIADLVMFATVGVVSGLLPLYLAYLNRQHAKKREAMGKSAAIVDESMVGKEKIATSKALDAGEGETEQMERPQDRRLDEDNALHDMTDLENEDFIYVY